MEDIAFIECLLFNLISLIFIPLLYFLEETLEERHMNTIHILTSQNMG